MYIPESMPRLPCPQGHYICWTSFTLFKMKEIASLKLEKVTKNSEFCLEVQLLTHSQWGLKCGRNFKFS
jgi:hypothetical protein